MNENHVYNWPYEDIVNLPHHVSGRHASMPLIKRAAQFAPFAALTGYDDAIAETARLTDDRIVVTEDAAREMKIVVTEDAARELNRRITYALEHGLELRIVHFIPDERKAGGSYRETTGKIRKIEMGIIVLEDGQRIPAADVIEAGYARTGFLQG